MNEVYYVTGYGRSGSTLLGERLGVEHRAVTVGEVHRLGRAGGRLPEDCSCGERTACCGYWSAVQRFWEQSDHQPFAPRAELLHRILEGPGGLLVPDRLLQRLVHHIPFGPEWDISFAQGIAAMTARHPIVDTSKTTRLTANRPRLIAATGAAVRLYAARRPLREVVKSHAQAKARARRGWTSWGSVVVVPVSRAVADFAARLNAAMLAQKLHCVELSDLLLANDRQVNPHAHLIGGNRRQLNQQDLGTQIDE